MPFIHIEMLEGRTREQKEFTLLFKKLNMKT